MKNYHDVYWSHLVTFILLTIIILALVLDCTWVNSKALSKM